jgi:3-hydroxyacyl-CoA dehydrogenase/enoyl-CoA hydratase/3-hydroxybutyryl-CoA epimerase
VRELATASGRPSQVAGLHFFNPVHRMPLVEVVRSDATSDQTVATLVKLAGDLGKVAVVVKDGPGFLVNRILLPYLDEAVRMVCEGVPAERVDREAERFGMLMGPLETLDLVGIDIAAEIATTAAPLSAEPSPTPQLLAAMVAEGRLGKKAGTGFYTYRRGRKRGVAGRTKSDHAAPRLPAPAPFDEGDPLSGIEQRLVLPIINASAQCLLDQIVREPWIVDLAMVLGTGFAPFRGGPLRLADTWGLDRVVAALGRLAEICGTRYQPSSLLQDMHRDRRTFYDAPIVEGVLAGTDQISRR